MSDDETITALDAEDRPRPIGKLEAHRRNIRHLAVSVFVFDAGRLLLQKRAEGKYHSGGLWANTVCSHPRHGEAPADCARRRMREELGFELALTPIGVIDYAAPVGDLFENERVRCFAGRCGPEGATPKLNPDEVETVGWLSLPALTADLAARPARFTPWLRIYLAKHRDMLAPWFEG